MSEQSSECGANIVQNLDGAELRIEGNDTGINVKEPDGYDEPIMKSFEKMIRFKATKHRRLEKNLLLALYLGILSIACTFAPKTTIYSRTSSHTSRLGSILCLSFRVISLRSSPATEEEYP